MKFCKDSELISLKETNFSEKIIKYFADI